MIFTIFFTKLLTTTTTNKFYLAFQPGGRKMTRSLQGSLPPTRSKNLQTKTYTKHTRKIHEKGKNGKRKTEKEN